MKRKKQAPALRRRGGKALRWLDLPEELLGAPRITLVGDGQMLVENHRGVFEYGENQVRLRTHLGLVRISGDSLRLRELGSERLYVEGAIAQIAYENAQRGET